MNFQIRTVLERIYTDRAGKGGVHRKFGTGGVGNFGNRVQITDPRGGVAGSFHMDEFGIGTDGGPDGLGVRGIQQSDFYAVFFGQVFPKQQVGSTIADLGDDGMVPGV